MTVNHQLYQSEFFRVVFEESSLAMTVQDERHRMIVVNQAYCDLVGYEQEDLIGQDPATFALANDNRDAIMKHRDEMRKVAAENNLMRFVVHRELIHSDQRRIPVRLEIAHARATNDKLHLYTSAIDLSGQHEAIRAVEKRHELIVLETHHRIKNNLHGLAGLIETKALKHPQLEKPLSDVAAWLGMVADIHGLQFKQNGHVELVGMIRAAATAVSKFFDIEISVVLADLAGGEKLRVSESQTLGLALIINELLTNACKYAHNSAAVKVQVSSISNGAQITISNPGSLPAGFSLEGHANSQSGLGLVNNLIPQQGMEIDLNCIDQTVVATLKLAKPVLDEV